MDATDGISRLLEAEDDAAEIVKQARERMFSALCWYMLMYSFDDSECGEFFTGFEKEQESTFDFRMCRVVIIVSCRASRANETSQNRSSFFHPELPWSITGRV